MPNLFSGINVALRAMLANQQVNEGVDPDVDSSGAPGPRQQEVEPVPVSSSPSPSIHAPNLSPQVGSGVMVEQIQRFNLEFFDARYRCEIGETRRWEFQRDILQQVEYILTETTQAGLIPKLDAFWSTWLAQSNDPSNLAQRKDLLERATGLVEALNWLAESLLSLQHSQNRVIEARVEEINSLGGRLAFLNAEISGMKPSANLPDDLLVQRRRLLNRLSEICGANASIQENGEATVSIGGAALVTGKTVNALKSRCNFDNLMNVTWQEGDQALQVGSGELAGLLAAREQIIPELLAGLNILAFHLASQVNTIHTSGFDLNGTAGQQFFLPHRGESLCHQQDQDALNIKLNPALNSDETLVAAASVPGIPDDGSLALTIANLKDASLDSIHTSFNEYYSSQIARLGSKKRAAEDQARDHKLVSDSLANMSQSATKVWLDEEAATLVESQHAFQAAARLVTSVDEMMDRIINGMDKDGS